MKDQDRANSTHSSSPMKIMLPPIQKNLHPSGTWHPKVYRKLLTKKTIQALEEFQGY
jgi:hypothetical protein